ncbi:MAG: hypothetical protein D6698_14330 [Gammaproteobacteria bacterium]|nr:MAG: hypothetical protein D6698_14330 [Gammaproteobacteria bacterium]
MGRRKKTRVEKFNSTVIRHKIVKLSYVQTLAVTGGIGNIQELVGTTDRKVQTIKGENVRKSGILPRNVVTKVLDPLNLWNGLFGKKVTRRVSTTVDDKGWRIQKTWLQPEFDKIRYALGIRELTVAQFTYEPTSELISLPWESPKDIAKVTLMVDEFIPPQFPPGRVYIRYYVKPDLPDTDWVEINPIGRATIFDDGGRVVPRVININSEKPVGANVEEGFISVDSEVKSIRFRAVLSRPDFIEGSDTAADSYSPVLKSYRLLLHPRGGL